ncbi:MAG: formate dehydrogenase accessory protein FdhE [Gemmatimonadetes bacterium]|nr:formate dehydrogenase accessory protein FdhE [Gemmatimonadota bacterium]
MRRPAAYVRSGVARRLEDLERRVPQWRAWVALLEEIEAGLDASAGNVTLEGPPRVADSAPAAPLLDGQTVRVDLEALSELLARLLKAAGREAPVHAAARSLKRYQPGGETVRRLIEAAICHDEPTMTAAAEADRVDPAALATVVRLVAVPPLATCAARLAGRIPEPWSCGYCPVCGSWPLLAELRGVERERVLRCGRCGTAWRAQWLRCTYCGETRHRQLGALGAAEALESRKAETCVTCRRYLKSIAALTPLRHLDLLLTDLETVELDVAAHERGYGRPPASGYRVTCRVAPA